MFNPFKKKKSFLSRPSGVERGKPAEVKPDFEVRSDLSRPKGQSRVWGTLVVPYITEKTTAASAHGWYAFRIQPSANRVAVKKAVEDRYGVGVEKVRILFRRPKKIRLGRIEGRTPGFKKAMVKIKAGQSIEFT